MGKEIPMLFKTEMVWAVLNNTKNQTRRTQGLKEINKEPDKWNLIGFFGNYARFSNGNDLCLIKCNILPGDKIWVKETFCLDWKIGEFDDTEFYHYKADVSEKNWKVFKWEPSLFMPKEAARIWLEVTEARIERLLDISEQDAIDEGIKSYKYDNDDNIYYHDYSMDNEFGMAQFETSATTSYFSLWNSINGIDSHKANPWCLVIRFKKI